ncbi:MAG: hypothetical protein SGI83_15240 [Bacteroidota bacterium]|nr:hypothetical protein [Bacteroidota bacterium]
MQTFKQADLLINIGLITIFMILIITNPSLVFAAYMVVGCWQLLSMFIHFLQKWFMKKRGARNWYHWITCTLLALVLLSQLITPFLLVFYLLLLGSPVLAIIYTGICYVELKELKRSHSFNLR